MKHIEIATREKMFGIGLFIVAKPRQHEYMEIIQDGAIVICSIKAEYNDSFVENIRINEARLVLAILIKVGMPKWYDLRFQYSSKFKLPRFREELMARDLYENISLTELVWRG